MSTSKAQLILLATVGLAAPAAALQVTPSQPAAGEWNLALSLSQESYDEFWVGSQKVSEPMLGEVETTAISLWARYGIPDRISVAVSVPYVDVDTDGLAGMEDSGMQDVEASVQWRLLEVDRGAWNHRVSLGASIRTPAGSYEGNAPISLGDDTTDAIVGAGWAGSTGPWLVSAQATYALRGEDAPDTSNLRLEVGRSFGPRVWTALGYGLQRASSGTDIGEPGFTFPSNKEELDRIDAELYVSMTPQLGLSVRAWDTLSGRNTGDSTGLSLGLVVSSW